MSEKKRITVPVETHILVQQDAIKSYAMTEAYGLLIETGIAIGCISPKSKLYDSYLKVEKLVKSSVAKHGGDKKAMLPNAVDINITASTATIDVDYAMVAIGVYIGELDPLYLVRDTAQIQEVLSDNSKGHNKHFASLFEAAYNNE